MKDNNIFLNWYNKRFSEYSEELPGDVWNNISDELDVNEVWQNVSSKLTIIEKRNILKQRIVFSLSTILIFLIFFFKPASIFNDNKVRFANIKENKQITKSYTSYHAVSHQQIRHAELVLASPNINKIAGQTRHEDKYVRNDITTVFRDAYNITDVNNNSAFEFNTNSEQLQESTLSINLHKDTLSNTLSNIDFASVGVISNAINTLLEINQTNAKTNKYYIVPSFTSDNPSSNSTIKKQREIYIGVNYLINNTWLINNMTVNGFNDNSLSQANINFTHNFGLSACYYSNNWNVELNGYINSKQIQSYHVYYEGSYITKQISLKYSFFNFSLKHRNFNYCNWLNIPYTNNLILGINFAFLREGKESSEEQTEQVEAHYYKSDFGLRLGYEYEFQIYKRFSMSSALVGDFGLKNIFKGNETTPGFFYRTHTGTIRINLGLKYLIKQ